MADEKKAAFGQYTTGRKYQGAKKRAEKPSDVNLIKDPKTYAAVMGLLGERPDEMGFSALHPDYEAIRRVADPAFAVGTALAVAPLMSMARFVRPVQQASAASQRGAVRVPTAAIAPQGSKSQIIPQLNQQAAREAAEKIGQSADPYTRSLQQGYEHGWYHGTTGDISRFRRDLLGETTGAKSAKKGFFFARDPQNPPEAMLKKSNDPTAEEMLRKLGIPEEEIAKLNTVSMQGHGAETASGYAQIGGSRQYKEAMRKANAAEKNGNWDEYEKQMALAEDIAIGDQRYLQELTAKYGDSRDEMLASINNSIYSKQLPQQEAELLDAKVKQLMPYGWYNSYSNAQLDRLKKEIQKLAGDNASQAIKSIEQFQSIKNERALAEKTQEGGNVMPVALRYENPMVYDFEGRPYRDQSYSDLVDQALMSGNDALILKNTYDPGGGPSKLIDVGVVFEPDQIRSRFAAFDPFRRTAAIAATMGVAAPDLLARTIDDEERRRQLLSDEEESLKILERKKEGGKVTFADSPDAMRIEMAEGGKAAFGVFPQMKPRRSKQDREAAKNVPVDLARGVISGALGIPGDIESLARLPYQLITGQESPTILPTSEDIEKRLPFKSDTPVGGVATGLGQIAGGFATPAPAIKAAKKLRQTIGNLPPANPRMSQMGVIKMKGGNWLGGSVEGALKPLKRQTAGRNDPAEMLRQLHERYTPEAMDEMPIARQQIVRASMDQMQKDVALNNWVDRNLTNYVKKEMATPEDPVRRLAEQGIDPQGRFQYALDRNRPAFEITREKFGFPPKGMGQSPQAQNWEKIADETTQIETAGDIIAIAQNNKLYGDTFRKYKNILEENPWLLKVDPSTPVYSPKDGNWSYDDTGFEHIIDVLREDLATGRIRPEQLNKVSMEQAVRRTYEYDQEMAKKMREAQIKATEGMPIYKEYPEGYKWVELKSPEAKVPEGSTWEEYGGMQRLFGPNGESLSIGATKEEAIKLLNRKEREATLESALKYEGETMGHCVGGYCPDVMEGRSRIFSLRDAKGEPHVTVEVEPAPRIGFREGEGPKTPEERFDLQTEWLQGMESGKIGGDVTFANWWRQKNNIPEPELPFQISQIKGKQNRAPKEEYLPFVQDFVRGGQWAKVNDFGNTGLVRKSDLIDKFTPEQLDAVGVGEYLTKGEYGDLLLKALQPPSGMKKGGKVRFTDNPDAMRLELQMSAGGIAKRMAKTIGKAAESAGQKPPTVAAKDLTTLQDTHTMLGDKVRARAMEAQKQMDEWNYKYSPGQHVFTQHGASKNLPPLRILERARSGNQVMRQDHPEFGPGMGKPIIDPATGKAMRTPYEPGYRVRRQNSPDPEDYAEFIIPEKSIVGDVEMATGGIARGLKGLAKGMKKEPAVPVDIPRVRPTPQAIEQAAERVARQQLGEHVKSPILGKTENLAGRSMAESKRVQNLQYKLTPTKELPPVQTYEQKIGDVNIALPGDQTVADMILESIEDIPIGSVQEGGAFYGLGKLADPEEYRAFWASNESAAQNFQNKVNEIAKQFDTDQVTAHHLAMGTISNNFAMHFADANLRAIDYSKLNRRDMETFDRAIADGYTKKNQKTGEYEHISFPNWPGIADPEGAKLAMMADPELRKWFNNRMKVPKLTQATNMPDGRSIQWAITEPLIRNSEINLTGLSVGRMKPGAELIPGSKHQTYSHDIAGTALGKAQELAPFEISFPDVTSFVREQYRPQDFTGTIQKVFPHQVVDEAYLEDLNKYYQRLRQIRGFNKGGAVHKAAGGEISADDLIIEERPL